VSGPEDLFEAAAPRGAPVDIDAVRARAGQRRRRRLRARSGVSTAAVAVIVVAVLVAAGHGSSTRQVSAVGSNVVWASTAGQNPRGRMSELGKSELNSAMETVHDFLAVLGFARATRRLVWPRTTRPGPAIGLDTDLPGGVAVVGVVGA
jgi:hypothetical protein